MAMYHFRIKTDKKPDGTRISPVQHVEYIKREGKYEEEKFVGNIISTAKMENFAEGMLYKTDEYGAIRSTEKGIEITEKASITTTAIGLMLASETQKNQPLIISDSVNFVQRVLDAAVKLNIEIKFTNKKIENEYRRRKEKRDLERRKNKSQDENSVDTNQEEQIKIVKQTVQEILEKMEEQKKEVTAESHVEYINREKAYERRGGCIFHSHHLPKWAKDDPKNFFKAADKYEGVGNRRYVEIEFALPNELKTVEQYRQIIDTFIAKLSPSRKKGQKNLSKKREIKS